MSFASSPSFASRFITRFCNILEWFGSREDNTKDNKFVITLLDEDVLFKHFQELYLIMTVEKEVGPIYHFPCKEVDSHDWHHKDVTPLDLIRFLCNQ